MLGDTVKYAFYLKTWPSAQPKITIDLIMSLWKNARSHDQGSQNFRSQDHGSQAIVSLVRTWTGYHLGRIKYCKV